MPELIDRNHDTLLRVAAERARDEQLRTLIFRQTRLLAELVCIVELPAEEQQPVLEIVSAELYQIAAQLIELEVNTNHPERG